MIYLLCKEKYQGEGRSFGNSTDPIDYSVVLLSTDGTLPNDYTEVQKQTIPYDFAPGSLLIDTMNRLKYIYDGQQWQYWAAAGNQSGDNEDTTTTGNVVYVNEGEFTYNDLYNYINDGKIVMLITNESVTSIYKLTSLKKESDEYIATFSNNNGNITLASETENSIMTD